MATRHTAFGQFLAHYRALRRADLLDRVPILLSEGDSWFSTFLYNNLLDWVQIRTPGGAFLRLESSGDLATDIFRGRNLKKIRSRVKEIAFDALLISAGGNDLVAEFLESTFKDAARMRVDDAIDRILASNRFGEVLTAYRTVVDATLSERPTLRILAHTYDYPMLLGAPARLTVEQVGLAALFKRSVGDWIARYVRHVLPEASDLREFARRLIDLFHDQVLMPLKHEHPDSFHIVDLRGQLLADSDWNDEMHPSSSGFRRLAEPYCTALRPLLPEAKRAAIT